MIEFVAEWLTETSSLRKRLVGRGRWFGADAATWTLFIGPMSAAYSPD